jgi:hypothetical protein
LVSLWFSFFAFENGHLQLIYPLAMAIFNGYVSLPEDNNSDFQEMTAPSIHR